MTPIRVLVVDDSVVVRRLLSCVIDADPDLEVAAVAANGRIALAKIPQVKPDVVTLDIEMPELDGLETLTLLRESWPTLPVVMFSTLTERGATQTLDALAKGASDYVTKPTQLTGATDAFAHVRESLVPKLKALCSRQLPTTTAPPPRVWTSPRLPPRPQRVDAVAVGVSTGGPNALADMLPTLPSDLAVPVLIVQHMPPVFTRILAERLAAVSGFPVREAVPGSVLEPGQVWLAPGDHHMVVRRAGTDVVLDVNQDEHENSCRPAVDVLFRSVAEVYGASALAVILTGMGQDGLRGCERLRSLGAPIVVQDEQSSVVWGMPGHVASAGLADAVLPLDRVGAEIGRRLRVGRTSFAAPR